jgi:hypothetical protein
MSAETMIAVGFDGRHERCFARLAKWLVVGLLFAPLGSACAQQGATAAADPKADANSAELPAEAQKLLSFGDKELAVVFAVDRAGNTRAYYNGKAKKGASINFPQKKDELAGMTNITVFQTKNPKTCWIDGQGYQQCVEW